MAVKRGEAGRGSHERRAGRRRRAGPARAHLRRRQPAAGGGRFGRARRPAGRCCFRCTARPIRPAIERYPHHWLYLGQVGKFSRLARAAGCRDVVFIGSLVRPSLWQIRLDLDDADGAAAHCRGFPRRRRSSAVGHCASCSSEQGFRLLGAHEVAPEILMPAGALGAAQPSSGDRADIALGLRLSARDRAVRRRAGGGGGRPPRAGGRGGGRHRRDARARRRDARERAACARRRAPACW